MFLLCALLAHCHPPNNYPKHWWADDEVKNPPQWEILPHTAGPNEVILSKRNELGLLSNFAATPFVLDGIRYASIEGFWQMMKFPGGQDDPRNALGPWPHTRGEVAQMTAFQAKKAGKKADQINKKHGIEWLSYQGNRIRYRRAHREMHYQLIRRAMIAKLTQNPDVLAVLLRTGTLKLKPDHHQSKHRTKAYDYHQIWMDLRARHKLDKSFLSHWSAANRYRIIQTVGTSIYQSRKIAVFDGDGTLWHADLPREFLDTQIRRKRLLNFDYENNPGAQRLYDTCRYDVSICIAQAAFLFSGRSFKELRTDATAFVAAHLKHKVFKAQQQLIAYLNARGFEIWVVSGGPKWLAEAAAAKYFQIPAKRVIGVQTRVTSSGVVTAEVIPPVPFRKGKVQSIKLKLGARPDIVVGNSKSDAPMLGLRKRLSIAIHSFGPKHPGFHYKSEQALVETAKERGWMVQKLAPDSSH